ncbi:PREDICTED: defensin-like protein 249 [Camelina sativa]|nr:PREDICTED: defensin-like protein 249 [Camelina sativa]
MKKLAAIFLASSVLFSLLPIHLSQGEAAGEKREWCPSKQQVFRGSCSDDGGQKCLNDLLWTWNPSVRLSPVYCDCTPKRHNKRLCDCPSMICL